MNRVDEAMIVAGGEGTRLRPLTATTPKPLLPFCDAPFLLGVIARLASSGIRHVLLVVGRDTRPFDVLRPLASTYGVTVETVPEPEPLDTAGGVISALGRVSGTFLVLNGDILTDVDLRPAIGAHVAAGASATIVLTRVEDPSSFGVCVREGSRIVAFLEKPPPGTATGHDTVNAGTYVLEPDVMTRFPAGRRSFEREVFPRLLDDGVHIEGVVGEGVWADLGTPERYLTGHRLALDGSLRWPTLGRLRRGRDGVFLGADAEIDPTAVIEAPSLIGGGAVIGRNCRVGPYAVVGSGCRLGAGSVVRDSVLAADARVGSAARLRNVVTGSGVLIGDEVTAVDGAVVGDGERIADSTVVAPGARVPSVS